MNIISRKEAIAAGLKHYFTGKPCKYGHISSNYCSSYMCVACHALHSQQNKRAYLLKKHCHMRFRIRTARLYSGYSIVSRDEFVAWALNDPAFNTLWDAWQAAGRPLALSPSIDRIDTLRGYVPGNMQFITCRANGRKANLWRWHGINPETSPRVKHAA